MAYPLLTAQMARNTETLLAAKQQILNLETARCSLERLGLTHPHPEHPTQRQRYTTEVVSGLGATLSTVHYSLEMTNWVPTVSDAVNIDEGVCHVVVTGGCVQVRATVLLVIHRL